MYIYRVRYIIKNEISKALPIIRKYKEKYTAITRSYLMLIHIYSLFIYIIGQIYHIEMIKLRSINKMGYFKVNRNIDMRNNIIISRVLVQCYNVDIMHQIP